MKNITQSGLSFSFKGKFRFLALAAMTTGILQAQTVVTLTTPGAGTFTVPSGVTSMTIECWGGGGAGGSAQSVIGGVSTKVDVKCGGGAGGSYAKTTIENPTAGDYAYTVGLGGVSAASGFEDGAIAHGENTSFGNATVVAVGGNGGASKKVTDATPVTTAGGAKKTAGNIPATVGLNYYGGAGATPVNGADRQNAAGGGSAGAGGDGGDAVTTTPGAAGLDGGVIGAATATSTNNGGINGAAPGAGGSGGNVSPANAGVGDVFKKGGNGGNGQIKITYTGGTTALSSIRKANTYVTVAGNNIKVIGDVNALEIYNAQGKQIQKLGKVSQASGLSTGIYMVKMHTAQGVNIQKISIK